MSKTALVPIADGVEDIETVAIIDILRRAEVKVTVASVGALMIKASRGTKIEADCLLTDCKDQHFDLIALPGGMPGSENLRNSDLLRDLLIAQDQAGRKSVHPSEYLFAAICAAPVVVLQYHGLLKDRQATCFPSLVNKLANATRAQERVVIDKKCITSRGAGSAIEFSLALVGALFDDNKAAEIGKAIVAVGY